MAKATKSNMAKAKTLYARLTRNNKGVRPERQIILKKLMSQFGMSAKGASSYYGTLKDLPDSEVSK